MFEYARDKFTKGILETELKLEVLNKEKKDKEAKLEIVDEVRYRKKLIKALSLTFLSMIIFAGICVGLIGLVGVSIASVLCIVGMLPILEKNAREFPGVIKLSNKELEVIISDLNSKIKDLDISINAVSKKLDEYKGATKFFDVSDSVQTSLNNLDYAYKYAKDEEEYNDMCKKQRFCQEEWDKFVNETVDYRNTHLVLNEPEKEEVKKLTKSYGKI